MLKIRDEQTSEAKSIDSSVVIACDGSASAIRGEMLKLSRFNFSQQYLDYGYKELIIPAGPERKHVLDIDALHIWPRGNYMLIALPNIDGSFACILFLPFEGPDSFASLTTNADVTRFFESRFPDAFSLMPQLADNLLRQSDRGDGDRQMFALARRGARVCCWETRLMRSFLSSDKELIAGLKIAVRCWNCSTSTAPTGSVYSTNLKRRARSTPTRLPTWQSRILQRCEIGLPIRVFCSARKWSWHWKRNIQSFLCPSTPW